MATTYVRQDQLLPLVNIDNQDLGVFATRSGGEVTADNTKIRPAAMAGEVSLGGPSTIGDLTIGRPYYPFRDDPILARYGAKVGSARVKVAMVALDGQGGVLKADSFPFWTGVLTGITIPDADANTGDAATFEITVSCDGRG